MKHGNNTSVDEEAADDQPQDDEGEEGDMDIDATKEDQEQQKQDDNVESSSTGSDGGKGGGSGSGGGYSADCSSSDGSSLEAAKGNSTSIQMSGLSLSDNVTGDKVNKSKEAKPGKAKVKPSKGVAMKPPMVARRASEQAESSLSNSVGKQEHSHGSVATGESSQMDRDERVSLPQWNGVRISHPMDPRIDLSIVNHVQTSSVPGFPTNVDVPAAHHPKLKPPPAPEQNQATSTADITSPSIDQYMSLMEVVHPFFHAYGMANGFPHPRSEPSNERPSSNFSTEQSDSDYKPRADQPNVKVPVAGWNTSQAESAPAAAAAYPKEDQTESDSSSLVVLARVKRKHMKRPPEESANDGSNATNNDEANTSSSSEKKVRIQQPQQAAEEAKEDAVAMDLEGEPDENDVAPEDNENEAAIARQQESTSASSSEERNNGEAPQNAPRRYGVPAVVSEYSSSARTGSSGASNANVMSTSGSGSGENNNTGSGSGSNQGGSSGSGNDQGGSSANGNGSSGSGNDVKGSSGENNSADQSGGNSDESNSNKDGNKAAVTGAAAAAADPPHVSAGHRHGQAAADDGSRDLGHYPLPPPVHDGDENAVREKKLQDKKRKRMNMRREYEEKVQQEMESSEGSNHRTDNLVRPGRPITLDKVLSFTKVARVVIKAGPPFLVVHTNAAYSRLSGIDSHFAVGKPISALLSIPDQDVLEEMASPENSTMGHEKSAEKESNEQNTPSQFDAQNRDEAGGHTAAEAAGRARAAASQEDNTDMCLERLVAASGFGRFHLIHVITKPHHMVGRNVTVKKPAGGAGQEMRGAEERSNNSSISSGFEGSYQMVTCSMGVSPVVSSPEVFNAAVVTDKDQDNHHHKAKRRKHHHHGDSHAQPAPSGHHQHRRNFLMREVSMNRKRHLITHYVIQLEPFEGTLRKNGNLGSQSSTSTTIEAHIMGLTKSELRRQRMTHQSLAVDHPEGHDHTQGDNAGDNDELESESSGEPREPVTAIG